MTTAIVVDLTETRPLQYPVVEEDVLFVVQAAPQDGIVLPRQAIVERTIPTSVLGIVEITVGDELSFTSPFPETDAAVNVDLSPIEDFSQVHDILMAVSGAQGARIDIPLPPPESGSGPGFFWG